MTFVGLDLHRRYITVCARDAAGVPRCEVRRMPVALDALLNVLAALPSPATVGMEATLYWQWLTDQLEAAGYAVRAADARQVKLIWHARTKTDPIDARKLAEMLRVGLFPAVWAPDADTRRRRQLLHTRAFLVRHRTAVKNRLHGRLTAVNLLFPRSDLYGRAGRAWLATVPVPVETRQQFDRLLRIHDALTREIAEMDHEIARLRRDHPMIDRLHTMPGIGLFGAFFLVAEIGTIERFASAHQLAAYAGLVPSTRSSGGKTPLWPDRPLEQSVAQVDPGRDHADAEAGPRAGRRSVPAVAARERDVESDDGGRAQALRLYLLDVEARPELRGVARATEHRGVVGGAPDVNAWVLSCGNARQSPVTRVGHLLRTHARVLTGRRGA